MKDRSVEIIWNVLDRLNIELPSWGFANTGTRFGKFLQPAAATTIEEKFSDAGAGPRAHRRLPDAWRCTCCGTFPTALTDVRAVAEAGRALRHPPGFDQSRTSFRIRSTNTDRSATPIRQFAQRALEHCSTASRSPTRSAAATSRSGSPTARTIPAPPTSASAAQWFDDGLSDSPRRARRPASGCWSNTSRSSPPSTTPTSPTGAWRCCSRRPPARRPQVLVDTGHHYQAQNIEQIVAWLLDEDMLGGFHFNDRRYADDDLTLGSIDPYQVFRIFHEIHVLRMGDAAGAPTSPT